MVRSVLTWLADHGYPRNVSGSMHRLQLHLALRYMDIGTGQPQVLGSPIMWNSGPCTIVKLISTPSYLPIHFFLNIFPFITNYSRRHHYPLLPFRTSPGGQQCSNGRGLSRCWRCWTTTQEVSKASISKGKGATEFNLGWGDRAPSSRTGAGKVIGGI